MKSCIVLGCGRSGTSMVSGILHTAGYFMGDQLIEGNSTNPKGFFEDEAINHLNEEILMPYNKSYYISPLLRLFNKKANYLNLYWLWLLPIPSRILIQTDSLEIQKKIQGMTHREPFAYKDPRFCYTLPVWEPLLPAKTVFICIFREPNLTAASILKECQSANYLKGITIDRNWIYRVYADMYLHVLSWNQKIQERILYVHYNQVFDGSAISRMSEHLETPLTGDFVDPSLRRTQSTNSPPRSVQRVYRKLCQLANYA